MSTFNGDFFRYWQPINKNFFKENNKHCHSKSQPKLTGGQKGFLSCSSEPKSVK